MHIPKSNEFFIAKLPDPAIRDTIDIVLFIFFECLMYLRFSLFLSKSKKLFSSFGSA